MSCPLHSSWLPE